MMRILSVIGALFLGGAFLTACTTSGRVSTFVVLPDTQTYLDHPSEHHNFKFREVDFDKYLR
ncbi:hypothetical protein [uncultured Bacteroides sp.]|jgi:hypothetical protein|uniref:hypothetical protein n=1 Tax=uncultured Bacteroides sp. TaxID=162156 RepID=UPI002593735B|nr:hypothetical protein [uncultured Bacteroides sp.]